MAQFNGSANGNFGTGDTTSTFGWVGTTNDTQLADVLGNLRFAGTNGFFTPATNPVDATEGGYGQYLITGLAQGTTYQVDLFSATFSGETAGRDTTFEVEGLTTQTATVTDTLTSADIAQFDLQANALGDIAINFGSDNANDLGLLSGVAITSAAVVPEPSSFALMFAGFLVLAVSVRRKLRARA
jgi:hypothetical protein